VKAPTFPIALKLQGRRVAVVGGGDEAAARARALAETGARVVVFARAPQAAVSALQTSGMVELCPRDPRSDDLDGVWLLVLAERNLELAAELARQADARQLYYCAVDDSRVGSFSHLAVARAGLVFAAIGSQGEAPALARRLREILGEAFYRAGLAAFADKLAALRRVTPSADRRAVLDRAVAGVRLDGELVLPPDDG
jgi:uroporphyrin-III C-methyltransferase/precorrin-2 dehydrogenase/sirohydrochlorin ferrochelatase